MILVIVNPAFAIVGVPGTNDNSNGSTTPSASEQQQQEQTANGFSLYENSAFGFTIQYPSDWRIDERNNQQPIIPGSK